MIKSILLDLDDTLLENDMDTFLPAYFQRLGDFMSELVSPDLLIRELLTGSYAMLENLDPTQTLERAFADHFYPAIGLTEEIALPRLEQFYEKEFSKLKDLTRTKVGVVPLIDSLLTAGYDVVIATNPLFPRTAVEQRLSWAGIPTKDHPFRLVTTYEGMHFAKPKAEYFAEILGMLGRTPHEALMAGDDIERDINPSFNLGMATFHVTDESQNGYPSGNLTALLDHITHGPYHLEQDKAQSGTSICAQLRGHLAALHCMAPKISIEEWTRRPFEHEWALVEIICHLRDVEDSINLPRIQRILAEDQPHLKAFETHLWAEERGYINQSGPEALQVFTRARMELLQHLDAIEESAWDRSATHSIFGPTTLRELMTIALEHDTLHLTQMRETLAAC
jgi:FMN phosphatase YigB (HAD superfamily)